MMVFPPLLSRPDVAPLNPRQQPTSGENEVVTGKAVRFAEILQQREVPGAKIPVITVAAIAQPVRALRAVAAKPSEAPDNYTDHDRVPDNNVLSIRGASAAVVQSASVASESDMAERASGRYGATARTSPGNDDLTDLTAGLGIYPATRFVDGSLFGHSVELPGSKTIISAVESASTGTSRGSGASSAKIAASAGIDHVPPTAARGATGPQTALAYSGQTPDVSPVAAEVTAIDSGRGEELSDQAVGTHVSIDDAIAASRENADAALPDISTTAGARSMPAGVARAWLAGGVDVEAVGAANEVTSTARPVAAPDIREAQVASLSPVHVVAAFWADGTSLRILARVSGAAASDEDQAENSLLAAVKQSGHTIDRLRLNGIERVRSVRS